MNIENRFKRKSRAEIAGELMGKAIFEMINLMYQKNTALNFIKGLMHGLCDVEKHIKSM